MKANEAQGSKLKVYPPLAAPEATRAQSWKEKGKRKEEIGNRDAPCSMPYALVSVRLPLCTNNAW
jgi:hypothetical protein